MTTVQERTPSTGDKQPIAILVGMTRTNQVMFRSTRPLNLGEYVLILYNDRKEVLGFVEQTYINSETLDINNARNFYEAYEGKRLAARNLRDKAYHGYIRIVSYLDMLKNGEEKIPSIPPQPGSEVYEACHADLQDVFSPNRKESIEIGRLLHNQEVYAGMSLDAVASNHMAIIAKTGRGKSNLVAQITKQAATKNATIVIFDLHDEYSTLNIPKINYVEGKIKPQLLSAKKFAELIGVHENYQREMSVLEEAWTWRVRHTEGDDFWDSLEEIITDQGEKDRKLVDVCKSVKRRLARAKRNSRNILDSNIKGDPVKYIYNNRVNVLNLRAFLDPDHQDLATSFYLQRILDDRKNATMKKFGQYYGDEEPHFSKPVIVVIEEAFNFIPSAKDISTWTKPIAAAIAREGRKFHLGLIIVSQRPRGLDENVLSQMGTMAIMQMTQKKDLEQIESVSESLSEEVIKQLPSLNKGVAVFTGLAVPTATFVKIHEVTERKVGTDSSAVEAWNESNDDEMAWQEEVKNKESSETYIPDGYIDDDHHDS